MSRSLHSREYESFRGLLVEARKKAGLSQAQLAARLSQPQSFASKFEGGERRLDVIEFKAIAEALNIVGSPELPSACCQRCLLLGVLTFEENLCTLALSS